MEMTALLRLVLLLCCALITEVYGGKVSSGASDQGSEVSSGVSSSSGSGFASLELPPKCNQTSTTVTVTPFDPIIDALTMLGCSASDEDDYIVFQSSALDLELLETSESVIFGDYFSSSKESQTITLEVCSGLYDTCILVNISATVSQYTEHLLPFGPDFSDSSVVNADDRTVSTFLSHPIPFWNQYYDSIHLSTNGLVSFGVPFRQYWPVTFPYGQGTAPVLAPYWTDLDFRNDLDGSGLFYHVYDTTSDTKRDETFLQEFYDRLSRYSDNTSNDFNPYWLMIVTWYQATPYYGKYNNDEVLTFQLALATDFVDTYAFFLYEENGLNWKREYQNIVVGYDAKDYVNYLNVQVNSSEDYLNLDSFAGNTRSTGMWYFKLSDPDSDTNFVQKCLKWAERQEEDVVMKYFEGLPVCPCTRQQADRDWRFWFGWSWGLTSDPDCAALVWSGRQSTIECCYDTKGALLVGPSTGGSYKLYHPWFESKNYIAEDKNPRSYCCQLSDFCSTFYKYRPSDNCSGYDPSIGFTWGDPHFRTIDDNIYTFNALGEYVLLRSTEKYMNIQVRLKLLESTGTTTFDATAISAVAIQHGNVQTIQIEEEDQELFLYVDGSSHFLPNTVDSNLIVTEDSIYDTFGSFLMSEQNATAMDYVLITYTNGILTTVLSSGASVTVSNSSMFLHIAVEVSSSFTNHTEGLLGFFNGDRSDDFYLPNGTIVAESSSEEQLYYYGLEWHVEMDETLFHYFDGNTYDTYNNEWDTFVPSFMSSLTLPPDVMDVCGANDPQCSFDYAVTGDMNVATATHMVTTDNQNTVEILGNHPPDIHGPLVIHVQSGVDFTESFNAHDIDGDDIAVFSLQAPIPEGISLEVSADKRSADLVWTDPGSELPSTSIQILANDSFGAVSVRNISVVLCACMNNGTCVNATTPRFNSNGMFRIPCACQEFFSGDLCGTDTRHCSLGSCPEFSICIENNTEPIGYTCTTCSEGYFLDEFGKCSDINECKTTDPQYKHKCTHNCTNSDGNYTCGCTNGYELGDDGTTCIDIDECYIGTDTCLNNQMCTNTDGGYTCSCYLPETFNVETKRCNAELCINGQRGCDTTTVCLENVGGSNTYTCICRTDGQYCDGVCSGDDSAISSGSQACVDCPSNQYGYRCKKVCDCVHGECDSVGGCVCDAGITGAHCDIEINQAAPVFAEDTLTTLVLSWNMPTNAVLDEFNATDTDIGPAGEVSFSLSHSAQFPENVSTGENIFTLDSTTGILALVDDLNSTRGVYTKFVLVVEAKDMGEIPRSTQAIVSVVLEDTPAPIPSFNDDVYTVCVGEDTRANTTILNLTCSEPEDATGIGNLTTELVVSNDSILFSLTGEYDDLMIVLLEEIDFEALPNTTLPYYSLQLTCINKYNITTSAIIDIEIQNVDDNPFEFTNSTYSIRLLENIPRYHEVLTVSAFDPDVPKGEILYNLVDPGTFNIYPINGTIYVSNPTINREVRDNYTLQVEATLDHRQTTQATINITVDDINENPPVFAESLYVSHNITTANTIGDTILVIEARDNDNEQNGSIVYSLEANPLFAINRSTGEIYINSTSIRTLYGSYILNIYASDEGDPPLNSSSQIDIYVAPSPDHILFHNLTKFLSVPEDQARGSTIGNVLAVVIDQNNGTVDPNHVGDVNYILLGVNTTDIFIVGQYTGEIILLSSLDFETQYSYIIQIEAAVPGQSMLQPVSAIIEVSVSDVNDNAPIFSPSFYAAVIEEFTPSGTSVLTLSASDRDFGVNKNIMYRIENGVNVPFLVDSVSGVVTSNEVLDTPRDYRFDVIATDGGISYMSSEAVVFISVTRSASVVPAFDRQIYTFNTTEGAEIGTQIGAVVAHVFGNNTIDQYTHLFYRIQSSGMNSNATPFHMNQVSGDIFVLAQFDAESQDQYAFYVEVYNATNIQQVFDTATVEVQVTDINDNSPMFLQSLYTSVITTAEPANSTLLRVVARDRDESIMNSQFDFTLISDTLGFDITPDGNIKVANSTLYQGEYYLTAVASDRGATPNTGTASVFIAVIPTDPQDINFEEIMYSFNISEEAKANDLVGRVVAVDSNKVPFNTVRYLTIADPNVTRCLHVGEFTGEIRISCTLNREREASYSFVVTAEVGSNITGQVSVVVYVLDINDNTPIFTRDVYANVVDTTFGNTSSVISVHADDLDFGQNASLEYMFESGSTVTDHFRILSMSGDIFFLDQEISPGDYHLTVIASDMGTPTRETASAVVFICVILEKPTILLQITTTEFSISENQHTGTALGTVQLQAGGTYISHTDYPDNLEFSIIGGDSEDLFFINAINGTVQVVGMLDYEEAHFHVVEVEAFFADYGISTNASITIRIVDLNDNDPVFNPMIFSSVIDDGYTFNQTVPNTNLFATDRDQGGNAELTFTISEINPFAVRIITPTTPGELQGVIYVNDTSLLIPGMTYTFSVIATDGGVPSQSSSASLLISVEHVLPDIISFPSSGYTFSHIETSNPQTPVGNVSIEQVTPALDELVYSVTGGTGMFIFGVNPFSGEIFNLLEVDREENTQFNLTVTAFLPYEPDLQPATTSVEINVADINDNIPVFHASYFVTVFANEITPYVPLLNVSASDRDIGLNAQLNYSISSGEQFAIDENGRILPTKLLPAQTYHLTVNATDNGIMPLSGSTLVIIDVREAVPAQISFNQSEYTFRVSEYTDSGSVVGTVDLHPPVASDYVQYVSFTTESSDFAIVVVSQSGIIRSLRSFDYETSDDRTIQFTVTAHLNIPTENPPVMLSTTTTITLLIQDENDNKPQFIDFPSTLQYEENTTQSELIAEIRATDEDTDSNGLLYYEILNDPDQIRFRIDHTTGNLFVLSGLDREQEDQYTIIIRVTDQGNPAKSAEEVIQFTLTDINDNVPVLLKTEFSVSERVTGDVFNLEYQDSDLGNNATATFDHILAQSDNRFIIDENSGVVSLAEELDYETDQSLNVRVRLRDNPGGSGVQNTPEYTITINVLDKPDNVPQFEAIDDPIYTNPRYTFGEMIYIITATDNDSDSLTYSINVSPPLPELSISEGTGRIYFNTGGTLTPEDSYTVTVTVTDDSEYTLSSSTTLTINVNPEALIFEEASYSESIEENRPVGTTVAVLRIEPLSQSTGIGFNYEVTSPAGVDPFNSVVGTDQISIVLKESLDRESIASYTLTVTASRETETETADLDITVTDVNDNTPVITTPSAPLTVSEDTSPPTIITQVLATDSDVGTNGLLVYTLISSGTPFILDSSGNLKVNQALDFEVDTSYVLVVEVRDTASPPLSSEMQYVVEISNINDNTPMFTAPAYFGELYSKAPNNIRIHHVVLEVEDVDGEDDSFSFSISLEVGSQASGYELRVSSQPPYYVRAAIIPDNAASEVIAFDVRVSDGIHKSLTVLYLGVYSEEHLLTFMLTGVSKDNFLSCSNIKTSLCSFRESLSLLDSQQRGQLVSYYNDSVEESDSDTQQLIVRMYGWYGDYEPRFDNGKEQTNQISASVRYLVFTDTQKESLAVDVQSLHNFDFGVELDTSDPVTEPTTTESGGFFNDTGVVGIICGTVLLVLIIALVIVLLLVFRRRKRNKPKRKEKDPYDLNYPRSRRTHRGRPSDRTNEKIALTSQGASSDLAYETMYDDDEILDQSQTMPWFDPNYLASNEGAEGYEGDTEPNSPRATIQRQAPLRATVDGDARRGRRHSSDESGGESVTELDHSHYLQKYQQGQQPLQPGQRMGEFDMFLRDAGRDSDRPHRPALSGMPGLKPGRGSHA